MISKPAVRVFSLEQEELFQRRYEEGFDLYDEDYQAWLKANYPAAHSPLMSSTDPETSSGQEIVDGASKCIVSHTPNTMPSSTSSSLFSLLSVHWPNTHIFPETTQTKDR